MDYKSLIEKEIEAINRIPIERVKDIIAAISRNIQDRTRIITSGIGKAGHIAHNFAMTLSSTGTPSFFLHPTEAQHGDLGIVCPGDIVILFSNSGKTREIHELIDLIHSLGGSNLIFAIIGKGNEKISLKCADYIEFGEVEEICPLGLTPTTSTTVMSVICDLIVVGLMKQNMFTKEKYSKFHHSGYLNLKARGIV